MLQVQIIEAETVWTKQEKEKSGMVPRLVIEYEKRTCTKMDWTELALDAGWRYLVIIDTALLLSKNDSIGHIAEKVVMKRWEMKAEKGRVRKVGMYLLIETRKTNGQKLERCES